jgi:hypothetical protein
MNKKIKVFLELIRKRNIDKILDAIAWKTPRWLFYYNHSILITTDNPRWNPREQPGYVMRPVLVDDIKYLWRDGFTDKKIVSRLDSGDRGVLMEKDGEVMTIVWGARGKKFLQLSGAIFDPGENSFFIYGAYTNNKARHKGLFYNVAANLYNSYCSENIKRIWGAVNANGKEWLDSMINRMNFRRAGETYYFKIFTLNICYYKSWPFPAQKIHIYFKNPPDHLKCV